VSFDLQLHEGEGGDSYLMAKGRIYSLTIEKSAGQTGKFFHIDGLKLPEPLSPFPFSRHCRYPIFRKFACIFQ
jgi:hypothetical protein